VEKYILAKAEGKRMIKDGHIHKQDGTYEKAQLGYPLFRRIGWQTRNKPIITKSGRLIPPLYSDGFSFSVMGKMREFSNPLVGVKNIQSTIPKINSGVLAAYMHDNGSAPKRLHISRLTGEGKTWSPVKDISIPNHGSATDIVTLNNDDWVLVYNDTEHGRNSLAVSLLKMVEKHGRGKSISYLMMYIISRWEHIQ
jgi:hypothetical protein